MFLRSASLAPLSSVFALTALLLAAGCESESPRGRMAGSSGGAPMTASGALAIPDPKPMDAQADFFTGQLHVEAMLAKSDAQWKNPAPGEGPRADGERGGQRGGGGFTLGGGGGGPRRGGGGGSRRGGGGEGGGEERSAAVRPGEDAPRGPAIRVSNAPPIQLRLRLSNTGDTPLEIEVLDFNSELGNFVVQPAKISLAPHATMEPDPMTSRLGVPAVDQIPLTVRIRVGGKTGATEQQILTLRPFVEAPPAAPTASAPAAPTTIQR